MPEISAKIVIECDEPILPVMGKVRNVLNMALGKDMTMYWDLKGQMHCIPKTIMDNALALDEYYQRSKTNRVSEIRWDQTLPT